MCRQHNSSTIVEALTATAKLNTNNKNNQPTPRPIIPSDSFAHLSAIKDGIAILPAPNGKGMGAFAATFIAKGSTLGQYTGENLTRRQIEARYWGFSKKANKHDRKWRNSRKRRNQGMSGDYLFDMGDDIFIDGEDADVSSWCRFANHSSPGIMACNIEARARRRQSPMAKIISGAEKKGKDAPTEDDEACHLYFVALRDIEAGTEICYDYGVEYWDI